jgi:hypothetical protein
MIDSLGVRAVGEYLGFAGDFEEVRICDTLFML